jgi:hypothetical protein
LIVRLYYHPESDALFWSDEWPNEGQCNDVTNEPKFRLAARDRGIPTPEKITDVVEASASRTMRGCGTVWKNDPPALPAPTGGMAGAIQKSYRAWERKPSDFYPTPYDVTESLMPVVQSLVAPGGKIWEPCAGDMDMTRVLEWHGYEVTSTDIRETGQGIGGFDFLNDDPQEKWGWIPDPDMIVMNPPFSLAAEFILKALEYTPVVACLMKIDYWNAIGRLPLWQANMPKLFLPLTWRPAFLQKERGNSPLMNCAWCVWCDGPENYCVIEPMRKIVYPGYKQDGVRTATSKLMQAVTDLTEVISACPR